MNFQDVFCTSNILKGCQAFLIVVFTICIIRLFLSKKKQKVDEVKVDLKDKECNHSDNSLKTPTETNL